MTDFPTRDVECRNWGGGSPSRGNPRQPALPLPKMITPSLFHEPPGAFGPFVSHSVCGGLPARSTFFSFAPSAE